MNIYDIAEKSQVSIATVSRVLNDSPRVSASTRAQVLSVMEKEGYVPNAFARGLGLNTMRMVGVMCTDVTDMFYANAVGCVEQLLRQQGLDVMLCCTGNNLDDKKKQLSYLVNRKVDAVILIGSAFKEEKDNSHIKEATLQLPVIIINGYINLPNVYCVVCDERGAMRENVIELVKQQRKRIVYLYDASTYSGMEKLAGYREGLCECNLYQDESLIVRCERSVDSAKSAVELLLRSGAGIDAVITSEDVLAAGALRALNESGAEMPVIGFNNSVIAECTSPTLSSVDNMEDALCEMAVRLLIDIEENKNIPAKTVISACLVERESFKKENLL